MEYKVCDIDGAVTMKSVGLKTSALTRNWQLQTMSEKWANEIATITYPDSGDKHVQACFSLFCHFILYW